MLNPCRPPRSAVFDVPSPDELIDRARAMVPEIRELAEETEQNRNVFPHIIDKIRDAELLRTCRPKDVRRVRV